MLPRSRDLGVTHAIRSEQLKDRKVWGTTKKNKGNKMSVLFDERQRRPEESPADPTNVSLRSRNEGRKKERGGGRVQRINRVAVRQRRAATLQNGDDGGSRTDRWPSQRVMARRN